ncbi:exported hypothetical protein [Xenorhabdus bovienii str. oregonense]|uniref:Uncharacterized protein n=1 Tax=Xenorhabdus bovienii str. oregonense TaxID=1398202 RepID=A0A077P0E1_XENBV|nr:hypothetical protein [Xenorhabdus bovienii]CDH04169.1 exported hypothetical protein [Xenorhabdus bovienii str. oregonense]
MNPIKLPNLKLSLLSVVILTGLSNFGFSLGWIGKFTQHTQFRGVMVTKMSAVRSSLNTQATESMISTSVITAMEN